MGTKKFVRNNNSGQMLIVTSLVVGLLFLSAIVYVTEIEKNAPVFTANANTDFSAIKQATTHTLISALANISNGGSPSVLAGDLTRFKSVIEGHSYSSISTLDFSVLNSGNYSEGIWVSKGNTGEGVASLFVSFVFNSTGNSADFFTEYSVNVTSTIVLNGTYASINESTGQFNMVCSVFNEGKPASARSISFSYQDNNAVWVQATMPEINDPGNGTYIVSFTSSNANQNSSFPISVHCLDTRGVSVLANVTCQLR